MILILKWKYKKEQQGNFRKKQLQQKEENEKKNTEILSKYRSLLSNSRKDRAVGRTEAWPIGD